MALWIGNRLNKSDRLEQRKEEERARLEKAIQYLSLLQNEFTLLIERLPILTSQSKEILSGIGMSETELHIPTPVWDILSPSGELPKLPLSPQLLASLSQFYGYLDFAKQGINRYLSKSNPQVSDLQSYQVTIQYGFEKSSEIAKILPGITKEEIASLKGQLAIL